MPERQTCPRREPLGMADPNSPFVGAGRGLDHWRDLRPLGGAVRVPNGLRSCSFCGSLHPDDFMAAIERGDIVGPTDKSYKAYVGVAYTADEKAQASARTADWIPDEHEPARDYAKFYYQHLTDDQRTRFIELVNAGDVKIGYPGHFYVLPFFARPAATLD